MKKILFVGLILLTSCNVGEKYKRREVFNDKQIEGAIGISGIVSEYPLFQVADFNDEILNNLIKEGLSSSPDLKVAILRLRMGRDNLNIASRDGFPMFDMTANYNYINESDNRGYKLDENYYQVGVDMNWEIDIFGNTRYKEEIAKSGLRSADFNLRDVKISLIYEIANNYISLRLSQQLLKNMRENIILQEDVFSIIKDKYKVSLVDEITLKQAEYLLLTMKKDVPSLEVSVEIYKNNIATLLGKLPSDLDYLLSDIDQNLIDNIFKYDILKLGQLSANVIRNRPDVLISEEAIISSNAELGVSIANMYPKFSISGFLGLESLKSSNLFERASLTNSLSPNITIPLFHFSQLRNNVNIQEYLQEEAFIKYEKVMTGAISDIKNAIIGITKEYEKNVLLVVAYNNMVDVANLMWKKYLEGLIDYQSVLDAEQRRLNAQNDMVNSNANLYKNVLIFYKAIGGD